MVLLSALTICRPRLAIHWAFILIGCQLDLPIGLIGGATVFDRSAWIYVSPKYFADSNQIGMARY